MSGRADMARRGRIQRCEMRQSLGETTKASKGRSTFEGGRARERKSDSEPVGPREIDRVTSLTEAPAVSA